ncbi:type II toxin-antitoxin system HicA family toxin [Candidatus Micrarchaeota archaeon]|nr:type II toxin-antitoxin system HicA family toxin [Candidatus Micrarchaeota archaeon]
MTKLPLLSAKEVAKILQKIGFRLDRQHGSHMFFKHPDGRTTTVPNHPGDDVDRGLLNKIIRKDLQINRDEFMKYA